MSKLLIVRSKIHDPWYNLALEEYLIEVFQAGIKDREFSAILYLWQNLDTVVIGRNQNAWAECLASLLEAEGGRLARRSTGGGAVFHDLGNLNFSLILPRRKFDLKTNFEMIIKAVASQGVIAEQNGRNDILADGRKFSGNAFSLRQEVGLHHGTLLINSDYARVARYLTVSPAKLKAKGVASVQSRIINLCEINQTVSVAAMMNAMEEAFRAQFGSKSHVQRTTNEKYENERRLSELYEQHASWNWRFGETIQFDAAVEKQMAWGGVNLGFQINQGIITRVTTYSDALDCDFLQSIADNLQGRRFHSVEIAAAILRTPGQHQNLGPSREQMVQDLAELVMEQQW